MLIRSFDQLATICEKAGEQEGRYYELISQPNVYILSRKLC